jgi:hypothetical protein
VRLKNGIDVDPSSTAFLHRKQLLYKLSHSTFINSQPGEAGTKMKSNHEDHEEHKDKNRINDFMLSS